jgi:hypothetical protein
MDVRLRIPFTNIIIGGFGLLLISINTDNTLPSSWVSIQPPMGGANPRPLGVDYLLSLIVAFFLHAFINKITNRTAFSGPQ